MAESGYYLAFPFTFVRDFFAWFFGKIPTALGVGLRYIVYRPFFRRLGKVKFYEDVIVCGLANMDIGDGSFFMARCSLYAEQGKLIVGKRCACNNNVMLNACFGEIVLGDDVIIGPNVVLRAADHAFDRGDVPIREQGHCGGAIHIEDNVWIGANVVVTRGVRISSGVVIGAGSVVTRDVAANTVVGGVPARVIRERGDSGGHEKIGE